MGDLCKLMITPESGFAYPQKQACWLCSRSVRHDQNNKTTATVGKSWTRLSDWITTIVRPTPCPVSSVVRTHSLHPWKTLICVPSLTMKGKKTPLPNLKEELMLEAWCLFKKDKEGLLPLPTSPLIIKLQAGNLSPTLLCKPHKLYSYLNKSLLSYHFASCWNLSALRHKGLELFGIPFTPSWNATMVSAMQLKKFE